MRARHAIRPLRLSRSWLTRFERSGQSESPDHRETMAYFARLAASSGRTRLVRYGVSPQGRELELLVAGGALTPARAHRSGKAIVLIQGCIHAGEVDGKDAAMLLLREMLISREQEHLLENVVVLVIPIVNPDGHERCSPTRRPNQNGPAVTGSRATSHGLNLNRDYMKADAPEMRALLGVYAAWRPHLIVDTHTTNGADYQYHVCYSVERAPNLDPGLAAWAAGRLMPAVCERVESRGFLAGPYIDSAGQEIERIDLDASLPRYSTGYAAAIDRVGLLVETHSLKPFGERVLATKVTCEAVLACAAQNADELCEVTRDAEERSLATFTRQHEPVPLKIGLTREARPFLFRGFETISELSPITDAPVITYTGEPLEFEVPLHDQHKIEIEAVLPAAYVLPPELAHLRERLRCHGLRTALLTADTTCALERSRLTDLNVSPTPFEGRQTIACRAERFLARVRLRAGSVVVPCAQPRVRVLAHLLEPESPDSFAGWGFFNALLEPREYAEAYILEPVARQMLEADPELHAEFLMRLEDDAFREDPVARLDFFYRRSPWWDPETCMDPVGRIPTESALERLQPLLAAG